MKLVKSCLVASVGVAVACTAATLLIKDNSGGLRRSSKLILVK
jgi:hypothetical protein